MEKQQIPFEIRHAIFVNISQTQVFSKVGLHGNFGLT